MSQNPLHREVLAQAAELAGGPAGLAQRLRVDTAKVQRWIEGKTPPPSKVVFAALNLIEREKHDA